MEDKPGESGLSPESLAAAEAALGRVRESLLAASRSEGSPSDVKRELEDYLHNHGPTLKESASALTEEVRQETLTELYKWREQLNAQLRAAPQDRAEGGGTAEASSEGQ